MDTEQWREELLAYRDQKDEYLKNDPHSPIPPEEREAFDGLDYFEPDPDLRFTVPLHEHEQKETITISTTTEGEREYFEWGEFRFEHGGEEFTLQAYRRDEGEEGFWLPFRDETNGEETYGAGRYIDLDPDSHRTADGEWVVDFNLAYNPFCAYSVHYECPLVPMENWLDVRIEAGEMDYESPSGYEADD
jgi:hypothetical protein